ncbi:methyltransferase, FxLD system [Sphaerisporangium perillae]|uniref:methyltransferase, FxLD system n=1 Tax=Sphaerisporangium perillae TaxID=2935860 RepID=UPI002010460D|nr:methyltransferase, FxLD system [Sphaerisporangium perillae]
MAGSPGPDGGGPDLAALRRSLAEYVRTRGEVAGAAVAEALRAVPRHLFLPGTPPEAAYRDEAIVTKRDAGGRPISSSSQPTIMGIMLDQLGVEPGARVLEIGAGTGYNAALIAHLTGPGGEVVSVDIDQDVADAARDHLLDAGFPDVRVVCADGAEGFAERAPYDRVIATVGVWDLAPAWLDQLVPDGRIVVPLDLRGVQCSVAMEREDDHWTSRSIRPCGFMRIRGTAAGPERTHVLDRESELTLESPTGHDIDPQAVRARLAATAIERNTGVVVGAAEIFGGLALWLAIREPSWCTLFGADACDLLGDTPLAVQGHKFTAGVLGDGGLALLRRGPGPEAFELIVAGYGPAGDELAAGLVAQVRAWDAAGRPTAQGLRIDAYPISTRDGRLDAGTVIDKTHTRLALSWPALA